MDHTNFSEESVEVSDVDELDAGTLDVAQPDPQMGPAKATPPVNPIDKEDLGVTRARVSNDKTRGLVVINYGPVGIRTLGQTPAQARHWAKILLANADAIDGSTTTVIVDKGADNAPE